MVRISGQRLFGVTIAVLLVGSWFMAMRPLAMGGNTSYIKVAGDSMEPAFDGGDLVVVRQQNRYAAGDVIAYQVATGIVIHRIIGGDPDGGFDTQGDNRPESDPWRPTPEQIVGSEVFHVPHAGLLVDTLQEPLILAGSAALSVVWLFAGGPEQRLRRKRS